MPEETAAATEGSETETPATEETAPGAAETKPTETVDFWKQKAREQETRAKANAAAAKRLSEIEEANKSEIEKAADKASAAERERDEARAEALRLRVAAKFGVSDEDADLFLTGTDEETLTKQAKRLTERTSERKKNGNVVPKEGATTAAAPGDEKAFVRELFGSG